MDKLRALLLELKQDEYVRFKYGKAVDAALKTLDTHAAVAPKEIEGRLLELLELVRGKKGGTTAPPSSKSSPRGGAPKPKKAEAGHEPA